MGLTRLIKGVGPRPTQGRSVHRLCFYTHMYVYPAMYITDINLMNAGRLARVNDLLTYSYTDLGSAAMAVTAVVYAGRVPGRGQPGRAA